LQTTSDGIESKTSKNDDVDAVTSSVDDESTRDIHSPGGGATDHVTSRCADDVEVADILHANPTATFDPCMTSEPEVTEVTTTEIIMAKTFTESTHPYREFVPIRSDVTDDVTDVDPTTRLTVRCELVKTETTSGDMATREDSVQCARDQVSDLTSELRHLQSLLDNLTSPSAAVSDPVDTSSDDELSEDWRQPSPRSRVVYHYHLHDRPITRRWIRRDDHNSSEKNQEPLPHDEIRLEHGDQNTEDLKTRPEENDETSMIQLPLDESRLEQEDLNTQQQELVTDVAVVKVDDVGSSTEHCQSSRKT